MQAGTPHQDPVPGDLEPAMASRGPSDDTLNGGQGTDTLSGGPGADIFYAQDGEADEIDCGPGTDVVAQADPSLDSRSLDCIDFVAQKGGVVRPHHRRRVTATGPGEETVTKDDVLDDPNFCPLP
jgi:Ca2+-binding RTX toxin-like protein